MSDNSLTALTQSQESDMPNDITLAELNDLLTQADLIEASQEIDEFPWEVEED